jgi:hypothetical protein
MVRSKLAKNWRDVCLHVAGTHIVAVPVGTHGLPMLGSKLDRRARTGDLPSTYRQSVQHTTREVRPRYGRIGLEDIS